MIEDDEISHIVNLRGYKDTTVVIKGGVNGVTPGLWVVRDLLRFRHRLPLVRNPDHRSGSTIQLGGTELGWIHVNS